MTTPANSAIASPLPTLSLDIIIPVFNEEAMIDLLITRLNTAFAPAVCQAHGLGPVRVIFVDDGSRDTTATLLADHIQRGLSGGAGFSGVLLRLSRNFGHQPALSAGLDACDADLVAVLDADLQDPPELILDMAARLRQGYDVAYALRQDRKDSLPKRLGCWAFYRLTALLSEIDVPLDTGDFCLMTRRVVLAMRSLPERLRFQRVLRAYVGFRQVGVEYNRPDRAAGKTKYSWKRLYRLATDGIASASIRPLRLAQSLAILCFLLSALVVLGFIFYRDRIARIEVVDLLFILLVVTVSGFGMLMLALYILGAYIGRTYLEVKARPGYLVMERVQGPGKGVGECQSRGT